MCRNVQQTGMIISQKNRAIELGDDYRVAKAIKSNSENFEQIAMDRSMQWRPRPSTESEDIIKLQ